MIVPPIGCPPVKVESLQTLQAHVQILAPKSAAPASTSSWHTVTITGAQCSNVVCGVQVVAAHRESATSTLASLTQSQTGQADWLESSWSPKTSKHPIVGLSRD